MSFLPSFSIIFMPFSDSTRLRWFNYSMLFSGYDSCSDAATISFVIMMRIMAMILLLCACVHACIHKHVCMAHAPVNKSPGLAVTSWVQSGCRPSPETLPEIISSQTSVGIPQTWRRMLMLLSCLQYLQSVSSIAKPRRTAVLACGVGCCGIAWWSYGDHLER